MWYVWWDLSVRLVSAPFGQTRHRWNGHYGVGFGRSQPIPMFVQQCQNDQLSHTYALRLQRQNSKFPRKFRFPRESWWQSLRTQADCTIWIKVWENLWRPLQVNYELSYVNSVTVIVGCWHIFTAGSNRIQYFSNYKQLQSNSFQFESDLYYFTLVYMLNVIWIPLRYSASAKFWCLLTLWRYGLNLFRCGAPHLKPWSRRQVRILISPT